MAGFEQRGAAAGVMRRAASHRRRFMLHSITHARVATVPIRGARRLARRGVGVAGRVVLMPTQPAGRGRRLAEVACRSRLNHAPPCSGYVPLAEPHAVCPLAWRARLDHAPPCSIARVSAASAALLAGGAAPSATLWRRAQRLGGVFERTGREARRRSHARAPRASKPRRAHGGAMRARGNASASSATWPRPNAQAADPSRYAASPLAVLRWDRPFPAGPRRARVRRARRWRRPPSARKSS